jgi:hypothetical protein
LVIGAGLQAKPVKEGVDRPTCWTVLSALTRRPLSPNSPAFLCARPGDAADLSESQSEDVIELINKGSRCGFASPVSLSGCIAFPLRSSSNAKKSRFNPSPGFFRRKPNTLLLNRLRWKKAIFLLN